MKQLAKIHKDKAELDRMKREVAKSTVEKGVNERTRLTKLYDKKRAELEQQHEAVRIKFEEEKLRVTFKQKRSLFLRKNQFWSYQKFTFIWQENKNQYYHSQIRASVQAECNKQCSKYESEIALSPSGGTSIPESLSGNTY